MKNLLLFILIFMLSGSAFALKSVTNFGTGGCSWKCSDDTLGSCGTGWDDALGPCAGGGDTNASCISNAQTACGPGNVANTTLHSKTITQFIHNEPSSAFSKQGHDRKPNLPSEQGKESTLKED